jgi:hypothetical protein
MTTAPKRRWFAYSLRTLFLVVMVLAAFGYWLGWNINVVHQRQALRTRGDVMFGTGSAEENERILRVAKPTAQPSLSYIRRLLGDEPAEAVLVFEDPVFSLVVSLFPEATVALFDPPEGWPLR